MNIAQRIAIGFLATVTAAAAHATGPNDGIYRCTFTAKGTSVTQYVTVNSSTKTNSAGLPTIGVFAFPEVSPGQNLAGYGIGNWSVGSGGNLLEGETDRGGKFAALFTSGAFAIEVQVDFGGIFVATTGTCTLVV